MISVFGCICCGSILSLWGSILFSFVLNTLSHIREGTVRYLWLKGAGEGVFKISGNGGLIFQMQQNIGEVPLSKIKQFKVYLR